MPSNPIYHHLSQRECLVQLGIVFYFCVVTYTYIGDADDGIPMKTFTNEVASKITAAAKWKIIGDKLELPPNILSNIKHENGGEQLKLEYVFCIWNIHNNRKLTWKTLIDALEAVSETTLANALRTRYTPRGEYILKVIAV